MYCKECGQKNEDDSVFCIKCGVEIQYKEKEKQKQKEKEKKKENKNGQIILQKPNIRAKDGIQKSNKKNYYSKQFFLSFSKKSFILFFIAFFLILAFLVFIYTFNKDRVRDPSLTNEDIELLRDIGIEMIFVEGGDFYMGCSKSKNRCEVDELPAHRVTLNSFFIGKYEVTQELWENIMKNNPSYNKGKKLPVENLSWKDVNTFIKKLNKSTGLCFRLPSEAEWEFAATGGILSKGYMYSGSNNAHDVGWVDDSPNGPIIKTNIVGSKIENELGIFDMTGNVSEYCSDWYDEDYYARSEKENPTGPVWGRKRVVRGGHVFWWDLKHSRNTSRSWCKPNSSSRYNGFRLAHD